MRDSTAQAGRAASSRTRPGEGTEAGKTDKGSLREYRNIGVSNGCGTQGRSGDRDGVGRA